MFETILVPLDGSTFAERVLPHVESLAQKYASQVILLMATPMDRRNVARTVAEKLPAAPPDAPPDAPPVESVDLEDSDRRSADKYLQAVALKLAARLPETKVTTAHPRGDPAREIVRRAARVDLIAMTTHGRSGVGRVLFGSVAEEVLRRAPCPILLVRPTPE